MIEIQCVFMGKKLSEGDMLTVDVPDSSLNSGIAALMGEKNHEGAFFEQRRIRQITLM